MCGRMLQVAQEDSATKMLEQGALHTDPVRHADKTVSKHLKTRNDHA